MSETDCQKKYCEPYAKKQLQEIKDAFNPNKYPSGTRKKMSKNGIKKLKKLSKKLSKLFAKEKILKDCMKGYCNPDCKGTLFEKGNPNKLPKTIELPKLKSIKNLTQRKKQQKLVKKFSLDTRKKLFGKKKNILKDSFYEKLSPKDVNKIKRKGGISGCTIMPM